MGEKPAFVTMAGNQSEPANSQLVVTPRFQESDLIGVRLKHEPAGCEEELAAERDHNRSGEP